MECENKIKKSEIKVIYYWCEESCGLSNNALSNSEQHPIKPKWEPHSEIDNEGMEYDWGFSKIMYIANPLEGKSNM